MRIPPPARTRGPGRDRDFRNSAPPETRLARPAPARLKSPACRSRYDRARTRTGGPMRTVILAGGLDTRLAEETEARPKPMVEIGGRPMLWHIMQHYATHWFTEVVLGVGYKGARGKRFFAVAGGSTRAAYLR